MNSKVPPISPEAINLHPSNTYHKIENLNLAIESARSIGCMVVNVRPEFIMEKREHIVLGLIWQIIKVIYTTILDSYCQPPELENAPRDHRAEEGGLGS